MAPRTVFEFDTPPPAADIDIELVALVREALGCADEPSKRIPAIDEPIVIDRAPRASSYEVEETRTWRVESASCTISGERTESYFPGDVNEPVREHEFVRIQATRTDGTTLTASAHIGHPNLRFGVQASPEERDKILTALERALGKPYATWDAY